jgi:geranylgeranyl diphosphate synthase type I
MIICMTAQAVTAPQQIQQTPAVLGRAHALVRPALEATVSQLHPSHAPLAGYCLGLTGADGKPLAGGQGKGVRQALVMLGSQAFGGDTGWLPAAVAIELTHSYSLVHDDIMDGDELRRHRPTAWKTFGVGQAILAGDALVALAYELMAADPRAFRRLASAVSLLISGQAADLAFETRPWAGQACVSLDEYRLMSAHKTGALMSCAVALGAVLAGADDRDLEPLAAAAIHLGLAFQATDDVLGIWGDPAVTGKPIWSDLRSGKKTFPIIAAAQSGTRAGERLVELLASGRLDEAALADAAQLVESAGGRRAAEREGERELDRALTAFDTAPISARAKADFEDLAWFLTCRSS